MHCDPHRISATKKRVGLKNDHGKTKGECGTDGVGSDIGKFEYPPWQGGLHAFQVGGGEKKTEDDPAKFCGPPCEEKAEH